MPNDFVASRSLAAANPAAARSSASSHEAGRSRPLSRTSGSVSRTCLLIERTFLTSNYRHIETTVGAPTRSMSPLAGQPQNMSYHDINRGFGHMRTLSEREAGGGRRVVVRADRAAARAADH